MKDKKIFRFVAFVISIVLFYYVFPDTCFSLDIPRDNTQAEYLYVFGPRGNPYDGADDVDHEQVVFINVPQDAADTVMIEVYDPDTGGFRDQKPDPQNKWGHQRGIFRIRE